MITYAFRLRVQRNVFRSAFEAAKGESRAWRTVEEIRRRGVGRVGTAGEGGVSAGRWAATRKQRDETPDLDLDLDLPPIERLERRQAQAAAEVRGRERDHQPSGSTQKWRAAPSQSQSQVQTTKAPERRGGGADYKVAAFSDTNGGQNQDGFNVSSLGYVERVGRRQSNVTSSVNVNARASNAAPRSSRSRSPSPASPPPSSAKGENASASPTSTSDSSGPSSPSSPSGSLGAQVLAFAPSARPLLQRLDCFTNMMGEDRVSSGEGAMSARNSIASLAQWDSPRPGHSSLNIAPTVKRESTTPDGHPSSHHSAGAKILSPQPRFRIQKPGSGSHPPAPPASALGTRNKTLKDSEGRHQRAFRDRNLEMARLRREARKEIREKWAQMLGRQSEKEERECEAVESLQGGDANFGTAAATATAQEGTEQQETQHPEQDYSSEAIAAMREMEYCPGIGIGGVSSAPACPNSKSTPNSKPSVKTSRTSPPLKPEAKPEAEAGVEAEAEGREGRKVDKLEDELKIVRDKLGRMNVWADEIHRRVSRTSPRPLEGMVHG